jgi:hypothetical protein
MADSRIYNLTEETGDKTGCSIPLDKLGFSDAKMVMYEDIVAEILTEAIPTISTHTITEVVDSDAITITVAKKASVGKTHHLQLVFSCNVSDDKSSGTFQLDTALVGTTSQVLSCTVDGVYATCTVADDSPNLQLLVDWTGLKSSATSIKINGTLITT